MLAGKLLEILLQDSFSQFGFRSLSRSFELKQKAFAKIPCTNSCRFKTLNNLQHFLNFLAVALNICPESQVIHQRLQVPAKVTVIIQRAYDKGSNLPFVVGKIAETQLLEKALGETLLYGESVVLRPSILAPVVDSRFVIRNIVILKLVQRHFLRLFGRVRIRSVIKYRILLQLLTHALLQVLDRKLYQLDGLNLQRRQLLCLNLCKS